MILYRTAFPTNASYNAQSLGVSLFYFRASDCCADLLCVLCCFVLLFIVSFQPFGCIWNKYLSIYLQLKGCKACKAPKRNWKKYFAFAYPLSKLVQTVSQSQSCFSIVVLGAIGKSNLWNKVTKGRPLYNAYLYLAIITLHIVDVHLTCLINIAYLLTYYISCL